MDNKYAGRILSISLAALIFSSYITVANIMDLQRSCSKTTEQVTILEQEVYELKDEVATILENCQPVEEEEHVEVKKETIATNPVSWDYNYVLRVVAAESRGEPLKGQMAVAQTIYETAKATGKTPEQVVKVKNQYASPVSMSEVNDSVREACERVFIFDKKATDEPIRYFYSTVGGFYSSWHENNLEYVMTIGNHKFFKEK